LIFRRWFVAASIVATFVALSIWTFRPPPYFSWLGAMGLNNVTPVTIVGAWWGGRLAPKTPLGFLSLFPVGDLVFFLALVSVLIILLTLLAAQWRDQRSASRLTRPMSLLQFPRIGMRVRTTLALVAVVGLELGWETVAWRNWRVSERYRGHAARFASSESNCRAWRKSLEKELAGLNSPSVWPNDTRTPPAQAADRAYSRDRLGREISYVTALEAANRELKRKYERAAADPTQPVSADASLPERPPQLYRVAWFNWEEHLPRLADYDELIRLYPDLFWAHESRAWILATNSDARVRNGQEAVAAATQAARLTNWKDPVVLTTLGAAYAEARDLASAVRWQKRALERLTGRSFDPEPERSDWIGRPDVIANWDRLNSYRAGKLYRIQS
jgi:hypothetical protein